MSDRIRAIYLAVGSTFAAAWLPLTVAMVTVGLIFGIEVGA